MYTVEKKCHLKSPSNEYVWYMIHIYIVLHQSLSTSFFVIATTFRFVKEFCPKVGPLHLFWWAHSIQHHSSVFGDFDDPEKHVFQRFVLSCMCQLTPPIAIWSSCATRFDLFSARHASVFDFTERICADSVNSLKPLRVTKISEYFTRVAEWASVQCQFTISRRLLESRNFSSHTELHTLQARLLVKRVYSRLRRNFTHRHTHAQLRTRNFSLNT